MIKNMICMKQLSLLGVMLNMLFVRTLILKLITLEILSKFHSLILKGIGFIDLPSIFRDKTVISIPSYFGNMESPIICYITIKYQQFLTHIPVTNLSVILYLILTN